MSGRNLPDFKSANEKAKLVSLIARLVRRHRPDDQTFQVICKAVRKQRGPRRPPRSRRLPCLLPEERRWKFYEAVDGSRNLQHQIMLRLLLYTAVWVSELANIHRRA